MKNLWHINVCALQWKVQIVSTVDVVLERGLIALNVWHTKLILIFWLIYEQKLLSAFFLLVYFLLCSGPALSFSHSPGSMFICDTSVEEYFKIHGPEHGDAVPRTATLTEKPFSASVLSDAAMKTVDQLESTVQQDLANRGIAPLCIPNELLKAALRLSHASSVAIAAAFPGKSNENPLDETDGIPGVIAVVKALQALGKSVSIVACDYQVSLLQDLVEYCCVAGLLTDPVPILPYQPHPASGVGQGPSEFLFPRGIEERPAFDMMVAVEVAGRTAEGTYLTMSAKEMHVLKKCSIDELFIEGKPCFQCVR